MIMGNVHGIIIHAHQLPPITVENMQINRVVLEVLNNV